MTYIEEITNWLETHKSSTLPAWLKRNPIVLAQINNETASYTVKNIMERVYIILNGKTQPRCEFNNPRQFNTFDLGYRKGCVQGNKCKCVAKLRMTNQKTTLLKKYGTESVSTIPGIVEKRKQTNLKKYGETHPTKTVKNRQQARARNLNRSQEQKDLIRQKSQATSIARYGVTHHMMDPEQMEKMCQTNMDRYGAKFPLQNLQIKAKAVTAKQNQTANQKSLIEIKKQQTLRDRYGVNQASQIKLNKSTIDILSNKDKFIDFVSGKTREQVLDLLKIHEHTLYLRAKQYQATTLFKVPYRSQFEQEVYDFVSQFTQAEFSERTILDGKEIDIFFPTELIGIECCGLYWHSELSAGRTEKYHYEKFAKCQEKNVKLITIFQDEWDLKRTQVCDRLRHLLKKSPDRIYARSCQIKETTTTQAKEFLNLHHIQGYISSKINLGLYYQEQLVAVMTFGNPRYIQQYQYEILRFASSTSVVGAAGKLFSAFVKKFAPASVVSYSDNRWGTGEVYQKLNFQKQSETIGYFYTDYKQRYNRTQFQKHKLIKEGADPSKSEWQIMQQQGYDRIWDCGQTRWVWKI